MADLRGAAHLFDAEHHSVKIEMSDRAGEHKTLNLSPVMLAYWFDFFSARYRNPSDWDKKPGILEVADVNVAEQLFRYCYDPRIYREWKRDDLEWSWIVSAVETCDMLQADPTLMDRVFELVRVRIEKAKGENIYQYLFDMMGIFRGIPVGANDYYKALMVAGFNSIDSMSDDFESAMTLMPEELYLAYAWHVFGTGVPQTKNTDEAIFLIARDIAAMQDEDGERATMHIHLIEEQTKRDSSYLPQVVMPVKSILEQINVSSTAILHARDTLMLHLLGKTFGKRARDE